MSAPGGNVAAGDPLGDELSGLLSRRIGWDEPPGLYLIYSIAAGIRLSPESVLPAEVWAEFPSPSVALAAIAVGFSEFAGLFRAVAPSAVIGAAFRFENVVTVYPGGKPVPGTGERHDERSVWAITCDRRILIASQRRVPDDVPPPPPVVLRPDPGTPAGPTFDALARITAALTAGRN